MEKSEWRCRISQSVDGSGAPTLLLHLLALLGGLLGCSSSYRLVNPPVLSTTDIYVVGENGFAGVDEATCWKDGVATALSDSPYGSIATGIATDGTDIYVSGTVNLGQETIAEFWKNGVGVALTDGSKNGYANGIAISGSDIYVVGGESVPSSYSLAGSTAEYWKNGLRVALNSGSSGAVANAIAVDGSTVYVVGYTYQTVMTAPGSEYGNFVATLWTNGVPTYLSDINHSSNALSVASFGQDVYVAGFVARSYQGSDTAAVYWKNQQPVPLSSVVGSAVTSIVVSGSSVFAAGLSSPYSAMYWIDGQAYPLSGSYASQILPVAGNVYVSGQNNPSIPIGGTLSQNDLGALYWGNGSPSYLPSTNGTAIAKGIAVLVH